MSRLPALFLACSFLLNFVACSDPKNPQTWIKRLRDPEYAPEAVKQLEKIGNPVAIKPLCDLYKDFESPNILKAIISFKGKDPDSMTCLLRALDLTTEDKYNNSTMASQALAELKAVEAVDALAKVAEKTMPLKSRANLARQAAIRALAAIGDKKAVPVLIKILEGKPTEQDFLLNKEAAVALGNIADPVAIPSLLKGLFMSSSIQGTSFPQARVAMVRMGQPAVKPLIEALQGKNEKLNAMPKEWDWKDENPKAVIQNKLAIVLGDMMAKDATPALLELLDKADIEGEETTIAGVIEALGKIGDERAVEPLVKILTNKKANWKLRMQVTSALTVMNAKKALSALLEVAQTGEVEDGYTNLMEAAAMAYGRIVGAEAEKGEAKVKEIMKNEKLKAEETQKLFTEILERMSVAKECKDDAACYGKKIVDDKQSLVKREKAGIMIAILPDGRKALNDLIKALPEREPVLRLYYLMAAKRIGQASDTELVKLIETLVEKDSKRTIKALGADLASEDKVALAVVQSKK